jgi:general secretion pathway protein G
VATESQGVFVQRQRDRAHASAERARLARARGFTLIELVLAVAVTAILVAATIPMYANYKYNAQVSQATVDVGVLQYKIDSYYTVNNQYPAALTDLGIAPPVDPWGFPYRYLNHALVNGKGSIRRDKSLNPLNTDYDLYSVGADGQSKPQITQAESLDDVIRAGNGGYVGLASQF